MGTMSAMDQEFFEGRTRALASMAKLAAELDRYEPGSGTAPSERLTSDEALRAAVMAAQDDLSAIRVYLDRLGEDE